MSTLQVKGGSGPAGRTLKTLNNKNNLVALYMRKQLEQLNREHTFCISHLDRDRFETHDFLQHIQRKDSEKHPAAIKYLGQSQIKENDEKDDTPSKSRGRTRPKRRRSKRKSTPQPEKFDDIGVDEEKEETPRTPRETGNILDRQRTFSIPHRNSQSSFTTLPSLDRRESVYFQIAAASPGDLSSDSSDDENEPTLETKTKDLSTRRRSSFVAWVQENNVDQKKKLLDRLKHVQLKDSPLEQRRNSFANFIQRYKSTKKSVTPADQLQDISEDVNPDNNEVFRGLNNSYPTDNHTDVMKSIMLNKPERRRKIVEPLNNRIDSFYSRIDHLKVPVFEFNSPAPKLTALERRRYTLLTKGINAALALGDSSDEEH